MTKSGYIAILGRPNVGKSTLMNALVGQRLSIVTAKPQTTRTRVLGILTTDTSQAIFVDTPGLLNPKYRLQEAMTKQIDKSIRDADVLLFMVDASDFQDSFDELLQQRLSKAKKRAIVAINKIDSVDEKSLSGVTKRLEKYQSLEGIVPISALRGDNLDKLGTLIEENLPAGPFLYPSDIVSTQPERFFAAEIIREEIFDRLMQEIPYSVAVRIDEFKERGLYACGPSAQAGRKAYIRAVIFVEKQSQKGIVIGAEGRMLKQIGTASRGKIEDFLDRPVYLDLWVKVRKNWRNKDFDLREFGYLE